MPHEGQKSPARKSLSSKLTPKPSQESPQIDGGAAGGSGMLTAVQTITSDSVLTTTTTHMAKTIKCGVSETRTESRIMVTGDADTDHEPALAQAARETRQQRPTRWSREGWSTKKGSWRKGKSKLINSFIKQHSTSWA